MASIIINKEKEITFKKDEEREITSREDEEIGNDKDNNDNQLDDDQKNEDKENKISKDDIVVAILTLLQEPTLKF